MLESDGRYRQITRADEDAVSAQSVLLESFAAGSS
jgi:hypothetical protein